MQTFLTIFHIAPVAQVKALSKALFSFLLVASFLASCTTDDPTDIINIGDITSPTFTCPEDTETISISIPIGSSSLDLTDALTTVTVTDDTDAEIPITYDPAAVTVDDTSVTATASDEAGNEVTCTFAVEVTQEVLSTTLTETSFTGCPTDNGSPVSLTLASIATSGMLTDEITSISSSATGGDTTNTYVPASVSLTTSSVTVTARDANNDVAQTSEGEPATCTFTVAVTAAITDCPTTADVTIDSRMATWTPPMAGGSTLAAPTFTGGDPTTMTTGSSDTQHTATFRQSPTAITYTVTYSGVTDSFNNPDTCSFDITIAADTSTDSSGPVFAGCTNNEGTVTISYPTGLTSFTFTDSIPGLGATDSDTGISAITYMPTIANDLSSAATVIATATNGATPAVESTCTFTITFDETMPENSEMFVRATPGTDVSADNPFLIATESDLSNLAAQVNAGNTTYNEAHYRLFQDIAVEAGGTGSDAMVTADSSNFTPIGTNNNPFQGNFDGNGKTLSGLRYNDSGNTGSVGLFGQTSNATISNLALTNVNINGSSSIGGLVGTMAGSTVMNVFVAGTVVGTGTVIGGFAGSVTTSSLINTATSVSVSALTIAGGLVGQLTTSMIINASASGTVSGAASIGGLIGEITGTTGSSNSITNAIAWGNVSLSRGSAMTIGGLIGNISTGITATVSNSYWDNTMEGTTQMMSAGTSGMSTYLGKGTTELQMLESATGIYQDWNGLTLTVDNETITLDEAPWNFGDTSQYPRLATLPVTAADQRMMDTDTP